MLKKIVLSHHTLAHISEIIVDTEIFDQGFTRECSMNNCNGRCCRDGVLLDIKDKEKILAHAAMIQQAMEPEQEKNISKWFDECVEEDLDFPSGMCDGTAVAGDGCVFLNSKGLCTLQLTAVEHGMRKDALKPFYCFAFPLTLDGGVLTTYDADFSERPACCKAVQNGEQSILDICREELEFMLGSEGLKEFEKIFADYRLKTALPQES
jgi:hypothetical protein